jgi:hypothetical protein
MRGHEGSAWRCQIEGPIVELRNPLTDEILFGQLEHGGTVHVGCDGAKLTFVYDPLPPPEAPPLPEDKPTEPAESE